MRMALTTVHAGWLTKSPPEKKLQGPLKFFKAHWRRRYFVLSTGQTQSLSSSGDDPPLAYLHYYDNEKNPKKSRKKGCIDLTNCEEILAQLDSVFYEHVFSLRTKDRGKTRTYFLAADSVEDMNVWISCLCRVLRMNDSDSGMPSPQQFSPSLFGQNFSAPNRTTSVASRNQDLSPIKQQLQSFSLPASSYVPPPSHVSVAFDYPSYCQPEEFRYGPRGSQSYYPPPTSSIYFPEAVSLSPSDSPPPTLPAKSNLRRSNDRLDPSARMSEYSNSSQFNEYNAAVSEFQRKTRGCKSSYVGSEYDFLPGRRLNHDDDDDDDYNYDYDIPPAARSGIAARSGVTSDQSLPSDCSANRSSKSSYPDVFDEEVSGPRLLPVVQSSGPLPIQMSSRTRSFRRSISRSDPPVSVLEPCKDLEELKGEEDEHDKRLLLKTSTAADDPYPSDMN